MSRDAKDSRDPREIYGVLGDGKRGIPKGSLVTALRRKNMSHADLARALGKPKSRTMVSEWISGARRMGNADVMAVSFVLGVSPLYILGLSPFPEVDTADPKTLGLAAQASDGREHLLFCLRTGGTMEDVLKEAREGGIFVNPYADYRDLAELAKDYVDACMFNRTLYAVEMLAREVSGHSAQVQGYPSLHKVRR